MRAISQRLRVLRGKLRKTQAAKKAGVSPSNWHDWEVKGMIPQRKSAEKIATAFGVSAEWILDGEGEEPKVTEAPAPYSALDPKDQKLLDDLVNLIKEGDDDIKRHLRDEARLLKRAFRSPKKRAAGKD